MLNSIPISLLVGCILGVLAGLGVGGGSLLILWLTLVLQIDHTVARGINLLFFIPSAVVATFFRWRQGVLDLKKVFPAVIAASICAGLFSVFSSSLELALIKKLFGGLLLLTGLKEIFYRPRNAK